VSVETVDCPACAEAGEVSPTCSCEGTGTVDVDSLDERAAELEQYEHWHAGQLGADQFCMACDQEAA